MDARWGACGFGPIGDALRPRRSCSPTPGGRNGSAPVCIHRLEKPGVGSSVDDLCSSTDLAIFVQYDVIGHLKGRERMCQYSRENEEQGGLGGFIT